MDQQYIDLIKKITPNELCNKLIELLSENKFTIEQLIEANENKQIILEANTFNTLGTSFIARKNGVKTANSTWAIKLYEYAAAKENDTAKINAAIVYLNDYLGEPDLDKALQHCLSAKESKQSRAQLLTEIYLKKREYDAAKNTFSGFEPVMPEGYANLLIKLCEELTRGDNWEFACNIETKLTIQTVNQQQKEKIINLLKRLEEKTFQLKENETELKRVIQNIVHIASKFSHISDPEIKVICDKILNPANKKLYELFIDSIYDDMAQKSRANENLANSIRQNSTQTLGGAKYVNELLQNARDAGCSRVKFTLTAEHLIFSHNGKPFSLRDIQGICSYATSDRDKAEDDGSIGEKGIGFKAVYNFTDTLNILFNESGFGFNRNHTVWKHSANAYPWQIIPIRVEREQILSQFPNISNVNDVIFIFKIKTPEIRQEMATHLSTLVDNSSILLFLDQLTTIEFVDTVVVTDSTLEKHLSKDERSCTIKKTNQPNSQWLLFKNDYNLSQAEQDDLVSKSDMAPKYRHRKNAVIQFAAPADIAAIEAGREHNTLACYFPTEVKLKLPFLVSAPFLLNSERSQLLDSAGAQYWNTILVSEIAKAQFIWFQQLAQTEECWQHPLALMAEPSKLIFPDRVPSAKATFEKKFTETLKATKFLRTLVGDQLVGIDNKMDIYGFVNKFGDALTKQSCVSSAYLEKHRDKLKRLGATEFDAKCIVQQLATEVFREKMIDPDVNRQLCKFFYRLNDQAVNTELKSVAFILSQNQQLERPDKDKIFEPSDRLKYATTGLELKLSLLHPRVNAFFRDKNEEPGEIKKRQAWLRNIGVQKLSVEGIVSAVNDAKAREITIQFLARVSQRFQSVVDESEKDAEKRKNEFSQLRKLTLMATVTDGKKIPVPIDRFYLNNDFYPVLRLRDKLPDLPIYLSAKEFGENLSPELNSQYKTFLMSLGVSETIISGNISHLWDNMINDENKFIFTKLLFAIFYSAGDPEKMTQFSELAKVLKNIIKFKTTLDKFVGSDKCYLADRYKPEFEIENHTNEIDFVSVEYIEDLDDSKNILLWHKFLVELGVRDDIRVSKSEKSYSSSDEYFDFLWKYQGYTAEGKLNGDMEDNELCPWATRRYSGQHKVNCYIEIEFIDRLMGGAIFWQIIAKYWGLIYPDSEKVVYSTQRSARYVPANIKYLALQSLKRRHNINSLNDLYAPSVQKVAAPVGLKVADVEVQLTVEQCEFFGFKTKLTAEDALKVLLHLQTKPVDESLLKKLELVYQHLATHADGCLSGANLSGLLLLNESNQFVPTQQLHGFLVEESNIQRYPDNANFVKKPHNVSLPEFEIVCRILGIETINKASLKLNSEPSNEDNNTTAFSLNNSITLLALLVIFKEQGIDHVTDEVIQTQLMQLKQKVDELVCKPVNKITVSYEGVFTQDLRAWLSQGVLFYKVDLDRSTQNAICRQLLDYLNLPIDLSELATVIFDGANAWLSDKGPQIEALYQRIMAELVSAQEVTNKKKRTHLEMQAVDNKKSADKSPINTPTTNIAQESGGDGESQAKRAKYSETDIPLVTAATTAAESMVSGKSSAASNFDTPEESVCEIEKTSSFEESAAKRAKYSETDIPPVIAATTAAESMVSIEDTPEESACEIEMTSSFEESAAKRAKYSETDNTPVTAATAAAESMVSIENTPEESACEIEKTSSFEESAAKRAKYSETDNTPVTAVTTAKEPMVSGKSIAASNFDTPQSFFGSQAKVLGNARPATTSNTASQTETPVKKNRTAGQIAADKQQGLFAEEYIFKKLKAKYSDLSKYKNFIETEEGFEVTIIKKQESGSQITVKKRLYWHNKKGETYSHFDMTFITFDSDQKEVKRQAIEVKSNAGTDVQTGIFGEPEMEALNTEENYIIWHVGNIRDNNHIFAKKIKNPKHLIAMGEIKKEEKIEVKTILNFSAIYTKEVQDMDGNKKSSQTCHAPPRSGL